MRIQNINNNCHIYKQSHNNNYATNFKAWQREVLKKSCHINFIEHPVTGAQIPQKIKEVQHRNDTLFFRDGSFWNKLVDFFATKYKDVSKVNVYDYACSNGSEAYTFIMSLLSRLDENFVKKFFPILAKDYDSYAIEVAQENNLPISEAEIADINMLTGGQFTRFFGAGKSFDKWGTGYYPARNELKDNVVFTQADILEDYKNINPTNSIVFARNFWPYLTGENQIRLAKNLYKQLDKNATVVIGQYDLMDIRFTKQADDLLRNAGFKEVINSDLYGLVYEK